jgi:hypothetical protein
MVRSAYDARLLPLVVVSAICALQSPRFARADDDPRDLLVLRELNKSTQVDFTDVPLDSIAEYLSDLHGIPIYLDVEAFEKAGVAYKDLAFTKRLSGVPLWQALRDTLAERKLSFMIKRHTLTITTRDEAGEWQKKNIAERKR